MSPECHWYAFAIDRRDFEATDTSVRVLDPHLAAVAVGMIQVLLQPRRGQVQEIRDILGEREQLAPRFDDSVGRAPCTGRDSRSSAT